MSSSHKCGQESDYSAFNATAAAFSQIFWALSSFLSNPQDTSSSLELLGRFLWRLGCKLEVCQSCPSGFSSLDAPPRASHLLGPTMDFYYVLAISLNSLLSSDWPIAQYISLGQYPHRNLLPNMVLLFYFILFYFYEVINLFIYVQIFKFIFIFIYYCTFTCQNEISSQHTF